MIGFVRHPEHARHSREGGNLIVLCRDFKFSEVVGNKET